MTLEQLLAALAERDITLFLEKGTLRYRAPAGALTPELREGIAHHRPALIERLQVDQAGSRLNGTRNCMFWDWRDWVDETPTNGRIRTVCGKCGRFIGYRPQNL